MGLFSSSSSSTIHHRSTTVRYVTVVALGFTVLVIMGVVRHSGLTEQHEPRASTLNPTKVNLGEGVVSDAVVDGDGRGGGAASEAASRRRQQSQQRGQEPRLEKEEAKYKTAPRAGAAAAAAAGAGAAGGGTPFPAFDGVNPAVYRYEVVNKFPHDPTAFTQGFLYSHPDTIFESTGSVGGPSTVREVSLTTGEVRRKTELDMAYFAEGLTMYKGKLAQITWRNNRGFFYDPATLAKTGEFATPLKDGWGLTGDAGDSDLLIVTDASKHLHFIDPGSDPMSLTKSTVVTDGDKVVRFANELETIGGEVWANVLERDCVVRGVSYVCVCVWGGGVITLVRTII